MTPIELFLSHLLDGAAPRTNVALLEKFGTHKFKVPDVPEGPLDLSSAQAWLRFLYSDQPTDADDQLVETLMRDVIDSRSFIYIDMLIAKALSELGNRAVHYAVLPLLESVRYLDHAHLLAAEYLGEKEQAESIRQWCLQKNSGQSLEQSPIFTYRRKQGAHNDKAGS